RGLEVEEIHAQGQGFDQVVSAQILERNPHPQADRLSLCKVTTGSGEPLEIVCGAQNMKAGDKVALAQIGAALPNGLKIALSKIRGVTSNGMLCSEEELKLKEKSEGILILPPSTPLGKPLAEILGLDDTVLTFKLTANRGDCLSHFGMAREVGAALGRKPRRPEALQPDWKNSPVAVQLSAGAQAPQFYGVAIEGVKIGPSPDWVVKRLEALGQRSINNVVDATNLAMLELGQPMHAYDADKIQGHRLGVRLAKAGESLPLLDASTVTLTGSELVIEDGARAVGLAGVMGGGNSEVQDSTTKLFLECAEFNPSLVRKASTKHQKKTEAAHRFERGVDPEGLAFAIGRLAKLVTELAGGRVSGSTRELDASRPEGKAPRRKISVEQTYFEKFLGMEMSSHKATAVLQGLDCQVENAAGALQVTPPTYRLDLTIREDLAEEIARSVGYDAIPASLPKLSSSPVFGSSALPRLALIDRAKDALTRMGLCETINFAFTSKAWLAKLGETSTASLINPLSEDLEALVPSLLPGLVRNALDNWHHHFGSESLAIRLFELRPTFHVSTEIRAQGEMETGVQEKWKLAFALSGPRYGGGLQSERGEVDFFDLKAVVEGLLETLGARGVRFQPMTASRTGGHALFHPGQSVEVLAGNSVAGYFGLLHPAKARDLKTRAPLWIGELDWDALSKLSRQASESRVFKPWPQFPAMERDFALVVKEDVAAERITQVALKAGKPLAKVAKVFDIYRGSQVAEGMTSVAVRVIFYEESRSLQEAETEAASAQILQAWKKELGAELRG
ncbi:MAG: phenylalanine--tRNA ligase subunit beta, partial [Bdellovibrionota bacterium]